MSIRRVDVAKFQEMLDSMEPEEITRIHENQNRDSEDQYQKFVASYKEGKCYLCGKPFKTMSRSSPCLHWLLRECKFKTKDFPLIYGKFDYHQTASFLRWVANQEGVMRNINDLVEEKDDRKLFEYTIRWKHIEWTFQCAHSDFDGHEGTQTPFPHYHFQMTINGQSFIRFGKFHIPFSEHDLFNLDLTQQMPDRVIQSFGAGGHGMEDAINLPPEIIVEQTTPSETEDEAVYRMQTMAFFGEEGIQGERVMELMEESKKTGKTLASLLQQESSDKEEANVQTFISPSSKIPDIAKRTERKPR